MKMIRMNENIDKLLNELTEKRKREHSLINNKQAVLAEAIMMLHKKEMRK